MGRYFLEGAENLRDDILVTRLKNYTVEIADHFNSHKIRRRTEVLHPGSIREQTHEPVELS